MSIPQTFRMDTNGFIRIWHANCHGADNWSAFCLTLFDRFTTGETTTAKSNVEHMNHYEPKWKSWGDDLKLDFISPKVFRKCGNIRRGVKKDISDNQGIDTKKASAYMEKHSILAYPSGYEDRPGTNPKRPTKALTPTAILGLWKELSDN